MSELLDKINEIANVIANVSRTWTNRCCYTSTNDYDYVKRWTQLHGIPYNCCFLNKEICDKLDKGELNWPFEYFDDFSKKV